MGKRYFGISTPTNSFELQTLVDIQDLILSTPRTKPSGKPTYNPNHVERKRFDSSCVRIRLAGGLLWLEEWIRTQSIFPRSDCTTIYPVGSIESFPRANMDKPSVMHYTRATRTNQSINQSINRSKSIRPPVKRTSRKHYQQPAWAFNVSPYDHTQQSRKTVLGLSEAAPTNTTHVRIHMWRQNA